MADLTDKFISGTENVKNILNILKKGVPKQPVKIGDRKYLFLEDKNYLDIATISPERVGLFKLKSWGKSYRIVDTPKTYDKSKNSSLYSFVKKMIEDRE